MHCTTLGIFPTLFLMSHREGILTSSLINDNNLRLEIGVGKCFHKLKRKTPKNVAEEIGEMAFPLVRNNFQTSEE